MTTQSDADDIGLSEAAEGVVNRLFFTPEGRADPYPLYHELRQTRPVHRVEADRPQFRDLVALFEMQPTPAQLASADAAQGTIETYLLNLIEEKRRRPREDLLSALVQIGSSDESGLP